ncbi:RSP_7527 family protein [Jannaschia seosinensis]|nr:hypothetical protein [Jannaschia seosinensis]
MTNARLTDSYLDLSAIEAEARALRAAYLRKAFADLAARLHLPVLPARA